MCSNSKVLIIQGICFLSCLINCWSMYLKSPGFDPYGRNKRGGHTTVCVEIKPNGVGSHEPYYMCKGPEFPIRQHILPPTPAVNGNVGNYALPDAPHKLQLNNYQPPINIPKTGITNAESYIPPVPQNIYDQHYNKELKNDAQMPNYSTDLLNHPYHNKANNPANFMHSNLQNINENIPSPPSSSKSEIVPPYENKNRRAELINPTTKDEQNVAATQPHINSEQFQALIDEEVLGTPNLGFSEDEMLPFHNLYSDSKHDDVLLGSQGPIIPPEYLDDPILRTFYNINDDHKQHLEDPYGPHINTQQPVFNDPSLTAGNINDCSDGQTNVMMAPNFISSAEPLHQLPNPNSCCGCPFTFQPIFIAIPWFGSSYQNPLTQMYPCPQIQNPVDYSQSKQSRLNTDIPSSSSIEDLTNKKISPADIKTNFTQLSTTTAKILSESSEDDDSVEVTTLKMDKVSKSDDDETLEDKEDDKVDTSTTNSTTETPFTTTKKTFKTRLHAAKMLAQMYSRGQNQNQDQNQNQNPNLNKRQIPYSVGGVVNGQQFYPYNVKRQYVRKLPKIYY